MTTFSVIIPTYGRPDALFNCLEGLHGQTRRADEVLVVVRPEDLASQEVVANSAVGAKVVYVEAPGVLAAMTEGFFASTGDWVAFTDDDAIASPTWLADIEHLTRRRGVVGVGGRDVLEDHGVPRQTTLTSRVGLVGPWGRFVGNHHCGTGAPRAVAMLKGVNCAYDAKVLGIPTGLFGHGAQAHFEVAIGLDLAPSGTLIYDPELIVRHCPASRHDGDRRHLPSRSAIADVASNAVLACGVRSLGFAARRTLYSLCIGDASVPGLVRCLIGVTDPEIRRRFFPSLFGTLRGLFCVATGGKVTFLRRPAHTP